MTKYTTFTELIEALHNTDPQPNPNYYTIIADNFELIIRESALTNQGRVAHRLGMSTLKLSAYVVMFKELLAHGYTLCNTQEVH